MKIDVEGAEAEVLRGAMQTLQACHPLLYLDTHQREAHYQTLEILTRLDYTITCLDGKALPESKELIARYDPD
jgi:GTP cyclohydrolase III